jgi:hypothetical protein
MVGKMLKKIIKVIMHSGYLKEEGNNKDHLIKNMD